MRIEIQGKDLTITPELRSHAETRAWLAAQRHAPRLAWISILLTEHTGHGEPRRITCTLAAGVKAGGTVQIQHTHGDPQAAVDLACARLEQALARQLAQTPVPSMAEASSWEVLP